MIKLSRKALCIDWDKRSLRIVVARVGPNRTVLEDAHSHRLPNAVDPDDPEAMGGFIRSMLRRHKLHHKTVVVDVPRERAVINRLTLPPTPLNEVAAAVRFQAMKELPFPLDSAAVDFVIMSRDEAGQATEVLLAAVTIETLDRVRLTCEAAGLTPARIGLRPYANLISVHKMRTGAARRVLFLDVGPSATEIDVVFGDALLFARSANVNVPLPPGDPGTYEDSRVAAIAELSDLESSDEAIEAAVNELLVEATRTLQAYRATDTEATVDELVVAGGTGVETQLADRLQQRLGLPVALFDPCTALGVDPAESPKLRSFSAALGLAWGLGREGALALDFLTPKRPVSSRETLQRRARIGVLAAIMVVIAVGGVVGKQLHTLSSQRDRLREANKELQGEVEQKLKIQNRIDVAKEWAVEAVWPDELLNVVQAAGKVGNQPTEKMVVQEIQLDTLSKAPGITLRNLFAADWQVPTNFVEALNQLEAGGERLYEASQGAYTPVPDAARFNGKADLYILLRKVIEFKNGAGKRKTERNDRLKTLGQL